MFAEMLKFNFICTNLHYYNKTKQTEKSRFEQVSLFFISFRSKTMFVTPVGVVHTVCMYVTFIVKVRMKHLNVKDIMWSLQSSTYHTNTKCDSLRLPHIISDHLDIIVDQENCSRDTVRHLVCVVCVCFNNRKDPSG